MIVIYRQQRLYDMLWHPSCIILYDEPGYLSPPPFTPPVQTTSEQWRGTTPLHYRNECAAS